ncbi:MAG: DUF3488 domain-containing protein [Verrucomicrobia bacterium]|nr:DUF3488 domain-containing protein [Verrucomicrobiota bacterium]
MRNPLHQLILLGFICQGLSWDNYTLPVIYGIAWAACVLLGRHKIVIGTAGECVLLLMGCGLGYYGAQALDASTHFWIGNGLVFVQFSRLLRSAVLTRRERIYSLLIAIFHVGVGATFIFDFRFVPMFLAAAVLLPRALMQMEAESFPATAALNGRGLRLGAGAYLGAMVLAVVFFLVFPRGLVPGGLPFQRPGPRERGTLADAVLDPARGGLTASSQVLLQIEGAEVGYLRSFALSVFDGQMWSSSGREGYRALGHVPPDKLDKCARRRVRVKNVAFLGRILPADGYVVKVDGKFFSQPYANHYGSIRCENLWSTANNYYEYWIDPSPPPDELSARQRDRHIELPKGLAERLQPWLDGVLRNVPDDPLAQAQQLERHFRRNFQYQLGAPALNRLNPVEDFILNQREGYCERFASALAVLLRMKGIPSRVMVGYLPSSKNWMSGWVNVRFKDAHAWTQAYIAGKGWVDLDATPAAELPAAEPPFAELLDTADFVWSAFVVNFDAAVQHQLFAVAFELVTSLPDILREQTALVMLLAAAVLLLFYWRQISGALVFRRSPGRQRKKSQVFAEHHYGRMLRALARHGLHRPPQLTPLEFLGELRRGAFPAVEDAGQVTSVFCATRYGERLLSAEEQRTVALAVRRIEQGRPSI